MPDRLILAQIALPLRTPFANAIGATVRRETILVGIEEDNLTGWGEAAPYPGATTDTVEMAWLELERSGHFVLDGVEPPTLTMTGRAALDEARADLAARRAGKPLWDHLGGTTDLIAASPAIGLHDDLDSLVERVGGVVDDGVQSIKLKISPGRDVVPLRALRRQFPNLSIGVDANGAYDDPEDQDLRSVDALSPAYIEQPLAAGDLDGHACLRRSVSTPILLDEPITHLAAAQAAVEAKAADGLVIKPGRLGIAIALVIRDLAADAGLFVKPSGLLETAIGRGHVAALASFETSRFCDLAPHGYMDGDPAGPGHDVDRDGMITLSGPGIGVAPDPDILSGVALRMLKITG